MAYQNLKSPRLQKEEVVFRIFAKLALSSKMRTCFLLLVLAEEHHKHYFVLECETFPCSTTLLVVECSRGVLKLREMTRSLFLKYYRITTVEKKSQLHLSTKERNNRCTSCLSRWFSAVKCATLSSSLCRRWATFRSYACVQECR